jgi:hypothetical protein
MIITICNKAEVAEYLSRIDNSTSKAIGEIASISAPRELFRKLKFDKVGFHPVEGHPLNLVEQINQTFTYLVALKATEWLLDKRPEAGSFCLSPGAHAAQTFDIMSIQPDVVSAEVFAAVNPDNNDKLSKDIDKLRRSPARFRCAFFYSPGFPIGRSTKLERHTGIEVHCVNIQ